MNAGQSGFYRVNFERDNWDKLISQLERDHKVTGIFSTACVTIHEMLPSFT